MNFLNEVFSNFKTEGSVKSIEPYGSGHIHDTYLVKTTVKDAQYILQKFNSKVFRNPVLAFENIRLVTNHIREKLEKQGVSNLNQHVLTPVSASSGRDFIIDDPGNFWRAFVFIPQTFSYDAPLNFNMVAEGGRAFGDFIRQLEDLPVDCIKETIPEFHSIEIRIHQFELAVIHASPQRRKTAENEISQLQQRKSVMGQIQILGREGKIPRRIVHHDTKINNVLFSARGEALCVIDLDTVMPGYVHDDFGDAIRTFANMGKEDDPDPGNVHLNMEYFEAFSKGFLESTRTLLNHTELDLLPFSALVMTYMQSIRFLTDYFNNDVYYKIHFPEQNLVRTKAQLALLLDMERQLSKMNKVIQQLNKV